MVCDVEAVLTTWAANTYPGTYTCTATPPELATHLPVIQIQREGGATGRYTDAPRVMVDVYDDNENDANALVGRIVEALLDPRTAVPGAVLRAVRCDSGPSSRPYVDPTVYRRGATLTVNLRAA